MKTIESPPVPDAITPHKFCHFIGIGGCGMSAIAQILLAKSYRVSGSDLKESPNTVRLKDLGATLYYGHRATNLRKADVVVVSTAIADDNPELQAARAQNLPIIRRGEMLAYLMKLFDKRIAVAGTHGKTTTTSMTTLVLKHAEKNPTYLIGADMNDFGGNAALGKGEYFVAESDESDGSFLSLSPTVGVLTNVEPEHMNYFKTEENLHAHFKQFMTTVLENKGTVVVNQDDQFLSTMTQNLSGDSIVRYSIDQPSDVQATKIDYTPEGMRFDVKIQGEGGYQVRLNLFGLHNVYNALAAIATGLRDGIKMDRITDALSRFTGNRRRFQRIGSVNGISVYDDYAHHPTEIKTTLKGAKACLDGRLICVFQPHRYSRTISLLSEFATCFEMADLVIITDIYSASEPAVKGVSGQLIVDEMKRLNQTHGRFIKLKSEIAVILTPELKKGDVVVTMGAGDIHTIAKEITIRLKSAQSRS